MKSDDNITKEKLVVENKNVDSINLAVDSLLQLDDKEFMLNLNKL